MVGLTDPYTLKADKTLPSLTTMTRWSFLINGAAVDVSKATVLEGRLCVVPGSIATDAIGANAIT
jgi:hypothetical protein